MDRLSRIVHSAFTFGEPLQYRCPWNINGGLAEPSGLEPPSGHLVVNEIHSSAEKIGKFPRTIMTLPKELFGVLSPDTDHGVLPSLETRIHATGWMCG
jgi:hypothetical protein